jgi:hypothetical protein
VSSSEINDNWWFTRQRQWTGTLSYPTPHLDYKCSDQEERKSVQRSDQSDAAVDKR